MRAAINLEFDAEDLTKFAQDLTRRFVVDLMNANPDLVRMILDSFKSGIKAASGPPPQAYSFVPPTKCQRLEATPFFEEGWTCHKCGTFNHEYREACRTCAHERCDTRPPEPTASGDAGPVATGSA